MKPCVIPKPAFFEHRFNITPPIMSRLALKDSLRSFVFGLSWLLAATALAAGVAGVQHVIVIGCDGMGSLSFTETNAPVMHRLMREGAWTLRGGTRRRSAPCTGRPNKRSRRTGCGWRG